MLADAHGQDVTQLLRRLQRGDREAERCLIDAVYPELRRLAHHFFNKEGPAHTLQPTAVVHEAYLRMVNASDTEWKDRAHFFAIASLVMREVLVDHARKRIAAKRGGCAVQRVDLNDHLRIDDNSLELVLTVDEALEQLRELDKRQAEVVQLRYFGGLSEQEIAEVLGVNVRTVKRDWHMAKAWLKGLLGRGTHGTGT